MEGNVIGEGDMDKKQSETRPSGAAVRTEVSTPTSRRCWVLLFPQRPQFFLVDVGVRIVDLYSSSLLFDPTLQPSSSSFSSMSAQAWLCFPV